VALEDLKATVSRCSKCSYCKWIPLAHVKSWRFAKGCPSIEYNKFQSYSASGRLSTSLSLLEDRSSYFDETGAVTLMKGWWILFSNVCLMDAVTSPARLTGMIWNP